jgi:hypothetical protein
MRGGYLAAVIAVCIAAALAPGAATGTSEDLDASYAAYRADVEALKERMLDWCAANREALEPGLKAGALSEEERFRKTCGKALDGREVPSGNGVHLFHFRQGNNVDGLEYFGVRRALTFNEDPYVLVTAWLIRTTTEVGQQRRTTETADAFLMGFHQGAWRTAWRYVDLDEGDWRLAASDDVGAEILSPELEAFIDRVWKQQVVEATNRLQAAVASGDTTLVPADAEP